MPDVASLLGFIAASLIVLLLPGPGVLYVVARSAAQGRRAGLVSVLGLSAGALVHVAAATLGLSALLLTSATAFGLIKAVGAGYLIYLGLRMLLDRRPAGRLAAPPPRDLARLFADGVIVSLFNPKIAVFFLAYLPQFVAPSGGPIPQQIFLLGILYVTLALVTDGAYALLAGGLRPWLGRQMSGGRLPRYLGGGVFVALGLNTALAERQP